MTTLASIDDIHEETLDGVKYEFRTPDVYDLPKMRRRLRKEGVRRPLLEEYRAAALAGIASMADATENPEEGERQSALMERWYEILNPISEDDIDEPDLEIRAAELEKQEAERKDEVAKIYPEVVLIEANLDRHFAPWRDLRADAEYYDEISRIDSVRLLLRKVAGKAQPIDKNALILQQSYGAIKKEHRMQLGTFALGLLVPTEVEKKS